MDYKKLFKEYQLNEEIKFTYSLEDFYGFVVEKDLSKLDNTTKLISCYILTAFFKAYGKGFVTECTKTLSYTKNLLKLSKYTLETLAIAVHKVYSCAQIKYAVDKYKSNHKKEFDDYDDENKLFTTYYLDKFKEDDINKYIEQYHLNTTNKTDWMTQ